MFWYDDKVSHSRLNLYIYYLKSHVRSLRVLGNFCLSGSDRSLDCTRFRSTEENSPYVLCMVYRIRAFPQNLRGGAAFRFATPLES